MFQEDNILSSSFKLSELEAHIGVEFENKNHLKKAFIHFSLKGDNHKLRDNQTLEFLGDAVLRLIISEYAYEKYESKMYFIFELSNSWSDEGRFSKFRDKLVIGDCISKIAKELMLGKYLIMSKGEKQNKEGESKRLTLMSGDLLG
jgi:ribonuclease-3